MLRRRRSEQVNAPTIIIPNTNKRRRIVVTGIGAITVLGLNLVDTWNNLVAGRSGIGPITQFDPSHLPVRIAGEVKGSTRSNTSIPRSCGAWRVVRSLL